MDNVFFRFWTIAITLILLLLLYSRCVLEFFVRTVKSWLSFWACCIQQQKTWFGVIEHAKWGINGSHSIKIKMKYEINFRQQYIKSASIAIFHKHGMYYFTAMTRMNRSMLCVCLLYPWITFLSMIKDASYDTVI